MFYGVFLAFQDPARGRPKQVPCAQTQSKTTFFLEKRTGVIAGGALERPFATPPGSPPPGCFEGSLGWFWPGGNCKTL